MLSTRAFTNIDSPEGVGQAWYSGATHAHLNSRKSRPRPWDFQCLAVLVAIVGSQSGIAFGVRPSPQTIDAKKERLSRRSF